MNKKNKKKENEIIMEKNLRGAFVWQILRTSGKHCLSFLETVLGSSSLKATLVTQTEQTPWPTTEIDGSAVHFSADTDFEVHSLLLYCAGFRLYLLFGFFLILLVCFISAEFFRLLDT